MQLGKLKKIPLREAWKHEAFNFTNWLAEPENLQTLGDEIGIDISLIQTEASVGKFSVDILAEEENSNRKVVIENQLESTDHDHLGKIITYASGFDAETIIWIVKDVRDEHKQAFDWLNENTNERIRFFAINIELWKIGDSEPAPKFNIISKPNNWSKVLNKSSRLTNQGKISNLQMLQFDFWTELNEFITRNESTVKIRTPKPQDWYDLSLGCGQKAHMSLVVHKSKEYCSVEIYIPNSKELFDYLLRHKQEIEAESGIQFDWMKMPEKQASRIMYKKFDFNLEDTDSWSKHHQWLFDTIEKIKPIFVKHIQQWE